ncbi:hypothetical protein MUK42_37509 [Musa troglodytarum]|uniref:Uncharacterized protein n=1 Tax=Musa troglodytarum TaxID=320322 RepID=A0A9E7EB82_9LILI|nr:hypothetical protein MUK42_37509 [Musa troglodytarum]
MVSKRQHIFIQPYGFEIFENEHNCLRLGLLQHRYTFGPKIRLEKWCQMGYNASSIFWNAQVLHHSDSGVVWVLPINRIFVESEVSITKVTIPSSTSASVPLATIMYIL